MTCLALLLSLLTAPCVPGAIAPIGPYPSVTTARERPPTEVHVGIGHESLTAGMSDWTDASARVQVGVAPGTSLHAEAVRTDRFDLVDTQLRVGASARLAEAWSGQGDLAVSPTGNALPDVSAAATLYRQLSGGWVVGVSGRHDAHDLGAVNIGTLITDYYVGDFLLGYAFSVAFIDGASAPGHRGSASRYYGDGSGVTVLAAAGQSVERVTPQDLVVIDIVALALWGVHWISPRLGLTYGAAINRHVDLYDRRRGEAGVRVRP